MKIWTPICQFGAKLEVRTHMQQLLKVISIYCTQVTLGQSHLKNLRDCLICRPLIEQNLGGAVDLIKTLLHCSWASA